MDNKHSFQSGIIPAESGITSREGRFKDALPGEHSEVWTTESRPKTATEKSIQRRLYQIYFLLGTAVVFFAFLLFLTVREIYQRTVYVDSLQPDYSMLDVNSSTYWPRRIEVDITTAESHSETEAVRLARLRRFAFQTLDAAMLGSPPYDRAQAVTGILRALTQHNIDLANDSYLQRLGKTDLIAGMCARTWISQALMYLRQGKIQAAKHAVQYYQQLAEDVNLKLNSTLNEEAFFGAVTVLHRLKDHDGLNALFNHHKSAISVLSETRQMQAYRIIAGEQARIGMRSAAQETAQKISSPLELIRAWSLIMYLTARPQEITASEPGVQKLPSVMPGNPPPFPFLAEQAVNEIVQYLVDNKELDVQIELLQRLAGSQLMCDPELHKILRRGIENSLVLAVNVKQPVLKLLDNPESPAIRSALKLPPLAETPLNDTAIDDWTSTLETVRLASDSVNEVPLRNRNDEQWIRAKLAVAQAYQSVKRFSDADRILQQMFSAADSIADSNIRYPLLLQIGEQQLTVGAWAGADQTFKAVLQTPDQNLKTELVRLLVIGRFFDQASEVLQTITPPSRREESGTALLQELIHVHDIPNAEKISALLPEGSAVLQSKSRLNITQGKSDNADFTALNIPPLGESDSHYENHCLALIRQGCFRAAVQTADLVQDEAIRGRIQTRLAGEYQLLYQSFNEVNDQFRVYRQVLLAVLVPLAERISQPIQQASILTELSVYIAEHLRTEEDRKIGNRITNLAFNACQNITEPGEKAVLSAKLITAKNFLATPRFSPNVLPFFTHSDNPSGYDEINGLIDECLELVNKSGNEVRRAETCIVLASALAQIGRTKPIQTLLDQVIDIVSKSTDRQTSADMLLSMVPMLRKLNFAETIQTVYRLAIDSVIRDYSNATATADVFEWRMRDSEIEQIIRSQLENGLIDQAAESADKLNEPVLRDRLLRTAAYIYLDQGDLLKANWATQRMSVENIQRAVVQNIQIIQHRSSVQTADKETAR